MYAESRRRLPAVLAAVTGLLSCIGQASAGEPSDAIARRRAIENPDRDSFILDDPSRIELSGQIQFRYQANFRDDAGLAAAGDGDTIGFVMRRAKISGEVTLTESLSGKFQFAFSRRTGEAMLEELEIEWELSEGLALRVGQFKPPLLREETVSSKRQLASDRSGVNREFTTGYSQGVEVSFGRDRWRATGTVSDGFDTENTHFDSASEADFAVTGRAELLLGKAGFRDFRQFTSFRGATRGAMVGVAGHWQTMGDTNPSRAVSADMTTLTADLSLVGSGWNGLVAGVWRSADAGTTERQDVGIVAQGGVFIADNDEVFARYQGFFPDDPAGATDLSGVTIGWNHYFSPESHSAKFTLDISYWFDPITSSGISASDAINLLPDANEGQVAVTAQVQLLF